MPRHKFFICILYALISLIALISTWAHALPYMSHGLINGNLRFWEDTLVNGASRFITLDIMFVFAIVWHWMMIEARRLKMRGYFWYLPVLLLIGFSTALPAFMVHREMARHRAKLVESEAVGLAGNITVMMLLVVALAYSWLALTAAS